MTAEAPDIHLPAAGARLATTFAAADSIGTLARALEASSLSPLFFSGAGKLDGILGWGGKPSAQRARKGAERRRLPFWTVEDGFLRSVGLGKTGAPSVSYLIDDVGIYYDASKPSRLEHLIAAAALTQAQSDRANKLLETLIRHRLSKYNDLDASASGLGPKPARRILLVDQTAGDISIRGGFASPQTFRAMIEAACRENPDAELVFRTHPDHAAGLAGSATGLANIPGRVVIDAAKGSPHSILDEVDEVWTVSSQIGFEALLRGLPVTTFGVPFYAGWGLTHDRADGAQARAALARRGKTPRTLLELVHAALISYPVYVHPATQKRISVEAACDLLVLWREQARRIGTDHICVGFSRWKRPHVSAYLAASGGSQSFVTEKQALAQAGRGDHVVVWGMKSDDVFAAAIKARGTRFSRIEDGFIRSRGLGSNFLFPWSLCLDGSGIYFDATRESDLEALLNAGPVIPEIAERAQNLRNELVKLGLTKYNLKGAPPPDLRARAGARRILLVLGQVPDDFSIRLGQVLPASNLDFLKRVRAENPDSFLIYKEHPDVVSGNRPGRSDPKGLAALADLVLVDGDTAQWIEACDHVHVMTSLAGFEALLRNTPVTCWGAPFYAGWGLTEDKVKLERRTARISLDDLVARTLIDYTLFRIEGVRIPVSPEDLLSYISELGAAAANSRFVNGFYGQSYRLLKYAVAQMAATLGEGRPPQLRFASGTRWPFFRKIS